VQHYSINHVPAERTALRTAVRVVPVATGGKRRLARGRVGVRLRLRRAPQQPPRHRELVARGLERRNARALVVVPRLDVLEREDVLLVHDVRERGGGDRRLAPARTHVVQGRRRRGLVVGLERRLGDYQLRLVVRDDRLAE